MALPYGEYSNKAFEIFAQRTDEASKATGAKSLLLCDVSGKLSIWNTSEKGEYTGKQRIVYAKVPNEDGFYLDDPDPEYCPCGSKIDKSDGECESGHTEDEIAYMKGYYD